MSNKVRTDEIDELVSSVRDFVSLKDHQRGKLDERLVLMPDQRIEDEDQLADATTNEASAEIEKASDDVDNVLILDPAQKGARDGLEATIAELEAAVTSQPDDFEADDGEEFVQQAAWAASAFETPEMTQEDDQSEAASEPVDDVDSAVAAAIDEAALRALVVEIVQQELGGEMGERITQNVRKLVRREINRMLTSQDLGH